MSYTAHEPTVSRKSRDPQPLRRGHYYYEGGYGKRAHDVCVHEAMWSGNSKAEG
jgi:hypothetical protein